MSTQREGRVLPSLVRFALLQALMCSTAMLESILGPEHVANNAATPLLPGLLGEARPFVAATHLPQPARGQLLG